MANQIVLADTSILIDYFRKTEKSKTAWIALFDKGYELHISAITEYEIYSGATQTQLAFWDTFLKETKVLPFDKLAVKVAVEINKILKQKRKQIDLADLFIAATSISNNLPFATLNKKHFERVDGLHIVE